MSRLPRFKTDQIIKGVDLNLLISALDTGGVSDLTSQTHSGITGQGLTGTVPLSISGSTSPGAGSVGAPQTPTGLNYRVGIDHYSQTHDGYAVISWTPNPIEDYVSRYDLYYHKGADPNFHNITVGGDVSAIRINSLIPGETYIFSIQAHDAASHGSEFSSEMSVYIPLDVDPPAVPTGLAATAVAGGILLTWTEVGSEGISNDLKQYQIVVSTDGGATYPNTYTIGTGNSWFYGPTVTTPYFKIASVDWTGNISAYSAPVNLTVGSTITGPITINPGPLTIGSVVGQTNSLLVVRSPGNDIEFGHSTTGGYGSVIGSEVNSGKPFLAFNSEAGSTVNTYKTRGIAGAVLRSDSAGGFNFSTISNVNADNQAPSVIATLSSAGNLHIVGTSTLDGNVIAGGELQFSTAVSKVVPGATSISLRNNADTADNLIILDAGGATFRTDVAVPNGNVTHATKYKASARITGTQSIAQNGAYAVINYNSALFDPNSNFDIVTNKGRYTCPVAGKYLVCAGAQWATAAAGTALSVFKNGASAKNIFNSGSAAVSKGSGTTIVDCAASDYLEIEVTQTAAAQNLSTILGNTWVDIHYLST